MKNKLPYHYDFEIKEHFGKGTKISYNSDRSEVSVTPAYSAESELTYENYKFLADLFNKCNNQYFYFTGWRMPNL
jgi:hypothetical protein